MNWRNGGDGDIQTAKYANSPRKETGKTAKDRQSRKDVYREIRQIREIGGNGTSKEVRNGNGIVLIRLKREGGLPRNTQYAKNWGERMLPHGT
jgi:hypothetical protein